MHPSVVLAAIRSLLRTAPLAALLGLAAGVAAQTTVAVPCSRDNTLYEDPTGSLSNGSGVSIFVGVTGLSLKRRALVHFDVAASVPAGARIVDARLDVNVVQSAAFIAVDVFGHRVLQDWGEGASAPAFGNGGGGAPAAPGDATWLHTFYPGSFWTTPGGDFAAAPSFTMPTAATLGPASSILSAALLADVQAMLDNPAQNFGWLLKTNEAQAFVARRIDSSETTLGTPPRLQVTYITPGQSAPWGQGCPVNGQPFTTGIAGNVVGGTTVQVTQSNGPAGQLAANLVALAYDPLGTPLLPQCSLYLPLGGTIVTHSLLFLSNAGTGSTAVTLPSGFPGVLLVWQSAALDSSSPAGFVLANARLALLQ